MDRRKYDFGRGTAAAWSFIAFARGDKRFPDARSWNELRDYLCSSGADDDLVAGARIVWRSFGAWRSRSRARIEEGVW